VLKLVHLDNDDLASEVEDKVGTLLATSSSIYDTVVRVVFQIFESKVVPDFLLFGEADPLSKLGTTGPTEPFLVEDFDELTPVAPSLNEVERVVWRMFLTVASRAVTVSGNFLAFFKSAKTFRIGYLTFLNVLSTVCCFVSRKPKSSSCSTVGELAQLVLDVYHTMFLVVSTKPSDEGSFHVETRSDFLTVRELAPLVSHVYHARFLVFSTKPSDEGSFHVESTYFLTVRELAPLVLDVDHSMFLVVCTKPSGEGSFYVERRYLLTVWKFATSGDYVDHPRFLVC
jgi:hypothetical protein